MRRPRARIGAELVPLVLILAALAGTLGMIVAVHRRTAARKPIAPKAVVAAAPAVVESPAPRPIPVAPPEPEPEPEPVPPMPPPPPPEDPTPKVLAPLRAAEAEQREEAARADRRAEALAKATKDAEAESERWKRREMLARAQVDELDARARSLERHMAMMAAERDVLARRRDVAKTALEQARARPSSAILPHKGPNGTWRRPIAVECRNGMAILQPKGKAFGLLDLSEGYGPSSNPFVAAIIREAVHIQGEKGPDGSPIVPYIFFVIRPDGIRPYYEARSRLEPLSITFGYELVDQETEIDFPDLDDSSTWDGSAPSRKLNGPLAQSGSAAGAGLEDDLSPWPGPRQGAGRGSRTGAGGRGVEFAWTMPQLGRFGAAGGGRGEVARPTGGVGGGAAGATPDGPGGHLAGLGPIEPPGDPTGETPDELAGVLGGPRIGTPDALDPGGSAGLPAVEPPRGAATADGHGASPGEDGGTSIDRPSGAGAGDPGEKGTKGGEPDPGVAFVWPKKPGEGRRGERERPSEAGETEAEAEAAVSSVPSLPTAREIADLRNGSGRPGALGLPAPRPRSVPASPGLPESGEGGRPVRPMNGSRASGSAEGDGPNTPPSAVGAPAGIGIGMPSIGAGGASGGAGSPSPTDFVSPGTIVDRTFELVVACGPRGATIHPGGYRVTADALNAPDGLLLRQMKGVVRERRGDDPHLRLEPMVRFLVQPGGEATYRAAKGQVMLSGLGWPTTFQVVGPDPVSLLPSESW